MSHDKASQTTRNGNPNFFANGVVPLRVNERGPEVVRAVYIDGAHLVQVFSRSQKEWITQAQHETAQAAIDDASNWY